MNTLYFLLAALTGLALSYGEPERRRLIVLADMGNEPDEEQQMLHLLMCSDQIDIEGLIAVTGYHLRPEDKRPYRQSLHPELLHRLVDGYERVYPNLLYHAKGWNEPERLRRIIASGQTGFGVASIGPGRSSEGSRLIVEAATRPDPRPLHIVVNAGSNTLAQALIDYRESHSSEELAAFVSKLRVYENAAQDDAGAWICHQFPSLFWIRSLHQTKCYGGPNNDTLGPTVWAPYEYSPDGQDLWAKEHIREGHGAFGELYPPRRVGRIHFIEGGGTIPWMGLVRLGLSDRAEPSWGGWSGRFSAEKLPDVHTRYKDIRELEQASLPFAVYSEDPDSPDRWVDPRDGMVYDTTHAAVWRWREAMWNDFQARMDWCVKPFSEANHHPRASLNGDASDSIVRRSAKPGQSLTFSAEGSTDPDGDALRFNWYVYPEAGARPYGKPLPIGNSAAARVELPVPLDAAGKELHLILEVWDESEIAPLVDYRRVVVSVAE